MLTVGTWFVIDAVLDNVMWAGNQPDGDPASAEHALALRERGLAASRSHPLRDVGEHGWPPEEATIDVALDDRDRAFVLARIEEALVRNAAILATDGLHPLVRAEQERSRDVMERARATLLDPGCVDPRRSSR